MPKDSSVVVCCVAKDIRKTFLNDFRKINWALSSFKTVNWIIVESNSSDDSAFFLQDFAKLHPEVHTVTLGNDEKAGLTRTQILARARNQYLEIVFTNPFYSNADYLAIADLNGLNNKISPKSVQSSFEIDDWDFCTANQSGPYYDIWALRHPLWSPNDCWEQLSFYRSYNKRPNYTLNAAVNVRMITIPVDSPPISVDSAFGGFGLLRLSTKALGISYEGISNEGKQICEHVSFCESLRKQDGKIYINPKMINTKSTDHSQKISFFGIMQRNIKYPFKLLRAILK
jgi:hypothetical protein